MASRSGLATPLRPWWKSASIYQIYPASFKDSNGDGVGDLPGIISKLDYLQGLGVDAIWISPFYESPNYDMGYDISDYTKPDPSYGKLEDVDALIKGAHDRGMKILFDLVINHTSHLHRWFKDAESSKDSPYRHYYIWRPPRYVDGKRLPPTNWKASFGGSVWEWSEKTEEYYLHCFTKEQPDLNWELEEVRDAVFKESITFWLERGVDGFRIDTIAMYSKGDYVDAPIVDPHSYVQPAYEWMHFGPRLHEWLQEMHKKTFEKFGAVSVGEFGGHHDTPFMLNFVGEEQKKFNMAIRFDMVYLDHGPEFGLYPRKWTLPEFKAITARCQELADPIHRGWLCNYFENHDQARSVSRFADDSPEYRVQSAKMLALHIATLSGTLLVYEGQEIGMVNMPKDWPIEEYIDPASVMHWKYIQEAAKHRPEQFNMDEAMRGMQVIARDHGRTPMQWSAEKQAGFTTADKTWMKVMDSYKQINAETEEADPSSVLHFWRKILKLRKEHLDVFVFGHFKLLEPDGMDTLLYTKQSYDSDKPVILVALNFSKKEQTIKIPASLGDNPKLLVSTEGDQASVGPTLKPWEGKVFIFE